MKMLRSESALWWIWVEVETRRSWERKELNLARKAMTLGAEGDEVRSGRR